MSLIENENSTCGSAFPDDASMLSSSIHSFVLKRMQSSALNKWQTADAPKSITGSESESCKPRRVSTKEGTEIAIDLSMHHEDYDDDHLLDIDDDFHNEMSAESKHHGSSVACDLSAASGHSQSSYNSTSKRVQDKKEHYRKMLSQRFDRTDSARKNDVSGDVEDEVSSTGNSKAGSCTTASGSTNRQNRKAGSSPKSSQLRRVKSVETEENVKNDSHKKIRKVVSDDGQGPILSAYSGRNVMEKNKRLGVALKPSASSPTGLGSVFPKRTVSDLGLVRRMAKSDDANKDNGNQVWISKPKAAARVPCSSTLDLRAFVDSRTATAANIRSTRKMTRTLSGDDMVTSYHCAKRQGRHNMSRTVSAGDSLHRLTKSGHGARNIGANAAPRKLTRTISPIPLSKNESRGGSKSSRPLTVPDYDWKKGTPITPPLA